MAVTEPLHPPGPELARRNRRIIAERLHWPDGALEACEAIDAEFPGFDTTYLPGGDMTHPDAGYYAMRRDHPGRAPWIYGATPDELRAQLPAEHIVERPRWDCVACGDPWPCEQAREKLRADMGSVDLAKHAWTMLEEAAADLPGMPVAVAFHRFLAWTRP